MRRSMSAALCIIAVTLVAAGQAAASTPPGGLTGNYYSYIYASLTPSTRDPLGSLCSAAHVAYKKTNQLNQCVFEGTDGDGSYVEARANKTHLFLGSWTVDPMDDDVTGCSWAPGTYRIVPLNVCQPERSDSGNHENWCQGYYTNALICVANAKRSPAGAGGCDTKMKSGIGSEICGTDHGSQCSCFRADMYSL